MELAERNVCTGCGACLEICPKGAIAFKDDKEGFPTPYIKSDQCIECGLCNKVCPAINPAKKNPIGDVYAAQILDSEALKDSTSGGLFTVFAREIFKRGGVVYGCIWDKDYNAVVKKAENENEMIPMRGSKYVWSYAGDTFPEVKKYLEEGREVLFTGMPCQVAGLKNYLRKDYENLYLLDFFCGGSPSPYAFHEYLKTITTDVPLDQLKFKFRDKEKYGWGVHISYQGKKGRIYQTYVNNSYFFCYHNKILHRMPCYHCQYRCEPRVEDITIGDYWSIEDYHTEFDVRKGVSTLLINSENGKRLFDAVKDQIKLSPTNIRNIALHNNLSLGNRKKDYEPPKFRSGFFAVMKEKGWTAAAKKYPYTKKKILLAIKQTKLGNKLVKARFKMKVKSS